MKTMQMLPRWVLGYLLIAFPVAPAAAATAPAPSSIEGTWTWDFMMPDGVVTSPKLTLQFDGGKLTGSTGFRPGTEIAITNGRVGGDDISFEVVRERDGRKIVTKYSGRLAGGRIRGKIESNWSGAWQSYEWSATKPVIPPKSLWRSVVPLPGSRKQRWRMRFDQQQDKLTGAITTSTGQKLEVRNGRVDGNQIEFDVERKQRNETNHFTYHGTVSGNRIEGTVLATLKGEKHILAWTAERPPRTIDGRWIWTHGGARRELVLRREGDRLTGKFIQDGRHEYEIEQGRITGVEIYFEVERERDAEKTLTKFRGTLGDDQIVGHTEFIMDEAAPRSEDWETEKVDPSDETSNIGASGAAPGRGKARRKGRR